jgi:hypothetical protein
LQRSSVEINHERATLQTQAESVKKFAGDRPEKAKYYSEDDDFLLEKEETSALYEVFYESSDA